MKPLRLRIQEMASRTGLPQPVVEKDFALSHLLAGIASHPVLGDTLVFKGGTALKKLFFGDYRFSEDLDFSAVDAPMGDTLEIAFREAVASAGRSLSEHGPFQLEMERYLERDPHPHGQEAFIARIKFPWHPSALCRIKTEITHDEPVLLPPEKRPLIHGYEEELAAKVLAYRLEEIVVEKLRSLLQTRKKLVERGWNRPRARDYYDLWRILDAFGALLDRTVLPSLLEKKCRHREVGYRNVEDFFSEELLSEAHRHWDANLRPFVAELPPCDVVLDQLRELLKGLFPGLS